MTGTPMIALKNADGSDAVESSISVCNTKLSWEVKCAWVIGELHNSSSILIQAADCGVPALALVPRSLLHVLRAAG